MTSMQTTTMNALDCIRQGLAVAIDLAQGKPSGAQVRKVEVPEVGVAKGTLLIWEHGRRMPTGPARVLLAMIAKRPVLVGELLR